MNYRTPLFLTLALLMLSFTSLDAQLRNRYSALHNNFQDINPAAINHLIITQSMAANYVIPHLQYQAQFIDDENALTNKTARIEYINRGNNFLFGFGIQEERIHVHDRTRYAMNGAKHWSLKKGSSRPGASESVLSGGIGTSFSRNETDLNALRYAQPGDLTIPISSGASTEVSGGLFLMVKNAQRTGSSGPIVDWYVGISGYHAISNRDFEPSTQWNLIGGAIFSANHRKTHLFEVNTWSRYTTAGGAEFSFRQTSKLTTDCNFRYWRKAGLTRKEKTTYFFGGGVSSNGRANVQGGMTLPLNSKLPRTVSFTYDFNAFSKYSLAPVVEIYLSVPFQVGK